MTACTGESSPLASPLERQCFYPKQPDQLPGRTPGLLHFLVLFFKWLSQLLLFRGAPLLQDVCQHQWASKGKQGVELILSMRKLARVAHEWKTPFYVVKIDIAKAFDSIAQEKACRPGDA